MRVITGTAKGRRLEAPKGLETRPTAARVKEAALSIIQFEVEGALVLDLFAGSGQMGIEALSRGARFCTFVDSSRDALHVVRGNLEHTRFTGQAKVVAGDAMAWVRSARGPFDIAFLDPPYAAGKMRELLEALAPLMSESGVMLCETGRQEELPHTAGPMALYREHRFGKTKITVYRRAEA